MNERRVPDAPPYLDALLRSQKVIVCCGAGGVGKTTTAAALGLAAARQGRRVLVLTIDPARRLGEALGLRESGPTPSHVERAGTMDAWMLDPRVVFEDMVRRLTADEVKVQRILQNKLYRALRDLVAGMQEYTAAEALYGFVESGKYDLVVLDTPPSRNALEFLEAPRKFALFLDERIVGVFMPVEGGAGVLMRGARSLVVNIFDRVFGEGFLGEVEEFLSAFSGMFSAMRGHSEAVRSLLTGPQASFVVVTSPEPSAIDEGQFLHAHLAKMGLPFAGYVLNRSWAYTRGLNGPESIALPADASDALRSGHEKLCQLAEHERRLAARDRALLATLSARGKPALATPNLGGAIEDFDGLLALAESFLVRERSPDALTSAS